jgi:heterodisulfide reductase subunit C2
MAEIGKDKDAGFLKEVVRLAGPEVRTCIQCGTCSASCPTASLMDKKPRQIIKMVLECRKDEALSAKSPWFCTSCQACVVRCPRGINPRAVMSAVREICEHEGRVPKDLSYDEIFQRQVRENGRVSELQISGEYALANPKSTVQAMELGLEMVPRRKISLERVKVKRPEEIERIFEELGKA